MLYVVSHENIHFPRDICLNPEQSRFTDCIVNPHHPCVTDLVWPWNLTLLGILELQSLYDSSLWTMQMERKYEVVCVKNSSKIIRLRADLQMTRMPQVCLSGFS